MKQLTRTIADVLVNETIYQKQQGRYLHQLYLIFESGWHFQLFVDAGRIDYVAIALSPDGTLYTEKDDDFEGEDDPITLIQKEGKFEHIQKKYLEGIWFFTLK